MRILHVFSNSLQYSYTDFDILIGQAALINLKKFGYTITIYCTEKDIKFLSTNNLLQYYDEVNSQTLEDSDFRDIYFTDINEQNFWTTRKLASLGHCYNRHQDEQVVYLDTDIVLFKPLEISDTTDIMVWSKISDMPASNRILFTDISIPLDGTLTETQALNHFSYNCGILYFKDAQIFNTYLMEYYGFARNNPCVILNYSDPGIDYDQVSGAQIAEQRLLYGLIRENGFRGNVAVKYLDESGIFCNTQDAVHYCYLRALLRNNKFEDLPDNGKIIYNQHYTLLLDIINNAK